MKCPPTILMLALALPAWAGDMTVVPWSWANADKGMTLVSVTDRVDIAVLRDARGTKAFQDQYGITFPAHDALFSTNAVLGVFVSPSIGFRGIIHTSSNDRDQYTFQLYDTGIQIEMTRPPEGKYWAHAEMILVDKHVADGDFLFSMPTICVKKEFGNHGVSNKRLEATADPLGGSAAPQP